MGMGEPILDWINWVAGLFVPWTGWHTLAALGFCIFWFIEWLRILTPKGSERRAARLSGDLFQKYRQSLRDGLDSFSRWIGDRYDDGPQDFSVASFIASWGWATAYPILFLLLGWAFLGASGKLGDLTFFRDDLSESQRALSVGYIAASVALLVYVRWRGVCRCDCLFAKAFQTS